MKIKASKKNLYRTIKSSFNRFCAILAIVALGAGFLGGLMATSPDMKNFADSYMDKYKLYDLDLVNLLGFSQEEIQSVEKINDIEDIQKAIVADDVFLTQERKRLTVRLFGILPKDKDLKVNRFELKEGSYPASSDECLVQLVSLYSASAPKVGDYLTVLEGSGENYKSKKVKVSGIVQSPVFFSAELEPSLKGSGSLELALYLYPDFFINDSVNHLYVTIKNARELDTWSDQYKALVENTKEKISSSIENQIFSRLDSISKMTDSLDLAFQKAASADTSLFKSELEAAENHKKIISLLSTSSSSQKSNSQKSPAQETSQKFPENDISFLNALEADQKIIFSPKENRTSYSNVSKSIKNLLENLNSYRQNIFSIQDRSQSTGYSSYKDNIEKIESLAKVFPAFFFFIALLVALTTMTRLVEEKRNEIGTLKSLGFSSLQILSQYIFYAFLSSALGCALGLVIGFKLFPAAVSLSYSMMYTVPLGNRPFIWSIAIPVSLIAICVILFATACACLSECTARPAALLSAKAPLPGKRIFLEYIKPIWKRLSFSRKVTARNMFRYKKRLFMTIAGIAGCSALLVAAFGLRDSLQDIITIQFDDLAVFNVSLMVNDEKAFEKDAIVKNILNDKSTVSSYLKVASENVNVSYKGKTLNMQLYVPEDQSRINNFMNLRTRRGHKNIPLTKDGIVMTEKQCEILGAKAGDYLTIENSDGIKKEVLLSAANECYMYANVYATKELYKNLFGKEPAYKAALVNFTKEKNNQQSVSSLMESSSVIYAMWIDSLVASAHKSISAINIVVFVIIITSLLLSIIVLYNLANINICERKREIATLLVLGYSEKEARKYIFREINILSVMGSLLGLLFGGPLHAIVVHATEVNVIMWGRSVHPFSYLAAFLLSLLFTFFVNLIMKKSITKISMVESLKSRD